MTETGAEYNWHVKFRPAGFWTEMVTVEQNNDIRTGTIGEPRVHWGSGGRDGTTPEVIGTGNFVAALTRAMVVAEEWRLLVGKPRTEHPLYPPPSKPKARKGR